MPVQQGFAFVRQGAKLSEHSASMRARPEGAIPERVIEMLGALWLRRVNEDIVQILLNVVDDSLLEVSRMVAEQTTSVPPILRRLLRTRTDCSPDRRIGGRIPRHDASA